MRSSWLILIILPVLVLCGCMDTGQTNPPEVIPGPSIIDIEDIAASSSEFTLKDSQDRDVSVSRNVTSVLCSGNGCMRYLSYLQATDMVSRIDRNEHDFADIAQVPYLLANPFLQHIPAQDPPLTPAQIQTLPLRPGVIILINQTGLFQPDELEELTGVPVLVLEEGDLADGREQLDYTLRVMGLILNRSDRAEEVIRFFDKLTDNLKNRVSTIAEFQHRDAYIGGIPADGKAPLSSTDPVYIPFSLVGVINSAASDTLPPSVRVSGQLPDSAVRKISPDAFFVDLSTMRFKPAGNEEFEKDSDWSEMAAVREGEVYGLLPATLIGRNHEIDLINAYEVGKVLYPEKFTDVDPEVMADYILAFLYGRPLYDQVNQAFNNMALSRLPVF